MTTDPDQQGQVETDALREAFDNADQGTESAPRLPPEPEWEAPGWTKTWKHPEAVEALKYFGTNPQTKSHYTNLLKQMEDTNGYITRRDQEFSAYRKHLDPIYSTLQPYEQRYALQGMTLQQGVQQLMQAAELLAQSPDQAFPWLGQSYRPQNPLQAIQQLAQGWGIDLGQVAQDQPYIDPQLTALFSPLQNEVQQLRGFVSQQQQQAQQAAQSALLREVSAFEGAKDEHGHALYPHYRDVHDDMVRYLQSGAVIGDNPAEAMRNAYQLACQMSPDIRAKMEQAAAEQAREKAKKEAATRTARAEQAETASRTVAGKSKSAAQSASLREAFDQAEHDLS